MSGNVWEWCWDWYNASYTEADNPIGPSTGMLKAFRGGGFNCEPYSIEALSITTNNIDYQWHLLGFRVCRNKS